MQRYFGSIVEKRVLLERDDVFHLTKVMRARVNEDIEVVADEIPFLCTIKSLKPLEIVVKKQIHEKRELDNNITLICALLKGDKLNFVLQKATELGVYEIVLLSTDRTIVKSKDFDTSKKLERYNRILKEASEQSHRSRIPLMYRLINIDELGKIKGDIKMIAYEEEAGKTDSFFSQIKKINKGDKVSIIIGPEGGFNEEEVETAKKMGYVPVSLGRRILRAETASIYALSVISASLERK